MFTFLRWREWLALKAAALRSDGFDVRLKENDRRLKSTVLEVVSEAKLAGFRNYESGMVDYEVLDTLANKWLANEAMISVDDGNFERIFDQFWAVAQP